MENRRESFSKNVMSLMLSQGIIKIFGLAYSMYLINKEGFGDSGNAIYMGGYQVYILLLTISSIGVPNAVAKLVSEEIALNNYKGASKIFKIAILCFGSIGFLGTLLLIIGAKRIACDFLLIPECEYSLIALSPSIFFVSIASVIKGYFNGVNQISKTAKAQTIEQIFKSILTIFFVEIISRIVGDTVLMASIANFASTCSILISFIYIFSSYIYLRRIQRIEEIKFSYYSNYSFQGVLKKIFAVSIPITFSAILGTLNKSIDSVTVVRILSPILGDNIAKLKYGILSSKVDMLTIMPLSFNMAFATALVPEISFYIARNDMYSINKKFSFSLLLTAIIAFPSAIGLSLYSNQIFNLLFPNSSSGGELLKISAFCIIFIAFNQTISGVFQGIGKTNVTVFSISVGIVVKFILNILLIPIYNIYEKGAIIGNLSSSIVSFIISWNILKRSIHLNFSLKQIIYKPMIASFVMAFSSYSIYNALINCGFNNNISIILVIIFAIFIYIISLLMLRIFSKDELFLLPNGEKIYIFFEKFKFFHLR